MTWLLLRKMPAGPLKKSRDERGLNKVPEGSKNIVGGKNYGLYYAQKEKQRKTQAEIQNQSAKLLRLGLTPEEICVRLGYSRMNLLLLRSRAAQAGVHFSSPGRQAVALFTPLTRTCSPPP